MDPIQLSEQDQADALSYEAFRQAVINDYRLAHQSRQASLLGRKEVLTGKAKFGIFGDGKEVPQVAMAKFFRPGDFYAGYYRDQTFAFATGAATIDQFFAQLYADPDPANDPHSAGRNMNNHFGTPIVRFIIHNIQTQAVIPIYSSSVWFITIVEHSFDYPIPVVFFRVFISTPSLLFCILG